MADFIDIRNRNCIIRGQRMIVLLTAFFAIISSNGQTQPVVVADSLTRQALSCASVFDRNGKATGITDGKGRLPYISGDMFPITIRYLGFHETRLDSIAGDSVFLKELTTELPEIVVESRQHKLLHILAYVREYSTLSTYTDTVFLFREKMVDYMIVPDRKIKFKGWHAPRVLKSKSYYRFTDSQGLDSVSDRCNHHFSWSDWIGIISSAGLPARLRNVSMGTDTVMGRYSPAEIWTKKEDRISIDINVLADTTSRKWVRNLSSFFKEYLDFENFRLRYNYADVIRGDSLSVIDLSAYSFAIESNGRGREMFRFNKKDEPFFVNTFAEVYILDKEYITVKEAKKWERRKFETDAFDIIEPAEAPALQASVMDLVARVNEISHDDVRLDFTPDRRLMGRGVRKQNIGQRALSLLKQVTGITNIRSRRNFDRNWNDFRKSRNNKNRKINNK